MDHRAYLIKRALALPQAPSLEDILRHVEAKLPQGPLRVLLEKYQALGMGAQSAKERKALLKSYLGRVRG